LRSSIHLSAYSTLQLYWTIGHPRCMKAYSEDLRTKIVEAVERENVLLITCIKNDRFRYTSADTPKSRRLRMGWCSKSRPKNKAPKPNPVDELWESCTPARAVLLIKKAFCEVRQEKTSLIWGMRLLAMLARVGA